MIIVPLAGDILKTIDGLPFKVVAYSNYNTEGPVVLAEPAAGGTTATIPFGTIGSINERSVKLVTDAETYKMLVADGYLKRDYQLPQPGDLIESDASGVDIRTYTVERLKIHVQNKLAAGMLLDVLDKDTGEKLQINLKQITNIKQTLFEAKAFLAYYADYTPKGSA
jgi:hypothetical protein